MNKSSKEFVLEAMRKQGRATALAIQEKASTLTGTELNAEVDYIPSFLAAKSAMNMLNRKAGFSDGFVCKSSAGRVVRLLQSYDSDIFTGEPEELPAQWGFVWSNDPAHALPFIPLSTSPYMAGNCCSENGVTYRSKIDNNVWSPSDYPAGWELVT